MIRPRPLFNREALHRWRLLHHWINRQLQHPDCPIEAVSLDEARILALESAPFTYPDVSPNQESYDP